MLSLPPTITRACRMRAQTNTAPAVPPRIHQPRNRHLHRQRNHLPIPPIKRCLPPHPQACAGTRELHPGHLQRRCPLRRHPKGDIRVAILDEKLRKVVLVDTQCCRYVERLLMRLIVVAWDCCLRPHLPACIAGHPVGPAGLSTSRGRKCACTGVGPAWGGHGSYMGARDDARSGNSVREWCRERGCGLPRCAGCRWGTRMGSHRLE